MPVNLFDANFYRAASSDLASYNDAQAWSHFQTYGLNEGRAFSPFVNLNFYRSSNSDLAGFNNRQAFDHIQSYGVAEGRQFSPLVDLNFYRANNRDLASLNNEQIFEHLRNNGVQEGRRFSPFVDLNIYSAANPDVSATGLNKKQLLEHLVNYGVAEGRRFSVSFDSNYYRSVNSDLARAGLNNKQLIEHFEQYGLREGRASSESFHVSYYLANNSDLKTLGFNNLQAQQHFEVNGYREGRLAAPSDMSVSIDPGNIHTAFSLGVLSRSRSVKEFVNSSDRDDFYRFTVSQSGIFTANLTGLTGDADIRLIQDLNNNNAIDQGEVQAWQWERGTQSESIRRFLTAGTYFLQVMSYNNQTANYNIATNFTAAASDDRQFSIQVNFGTGSEGLSDAMKNAVQEAARFWENVIPYSRFSGNQTLAINVEGADLGWSNNGGILAEAGPEAVGLDAAGRWMPMSGITDINTNPNAFARLSSNINFFRSVMIHEFAHVLGIGCLWGNEYYQRNVINFTTGTYNANTYAGWAYGEMRGTFIQTAIELTTGVGDGSDYGHWREDVFGSEIMTHTGDEQHSMPLSQLTIAALRDLGWNVNYGAAEAYSLVS